LQASLPEDVDERSQHPLRRIVTWGASPQAQKIVPWKASDRICGKRLKATIPVLMAAIEKHGHLALDLQVRARRETSVRPPSTACWPRRARAADAGARSHHYAR
jgi:hypothetical protein